MGRIGRRRKKERRTFKDNVSAKDKTESRQGVEDRFGLECEKHSLHDSHPAVSTFTDAAIQVGKESSDGNHEVEGGNVFNGIVRPCTTNDLSPPVLCNIASVPKETDPQTTAVPSCT